VGFRARLDAVVKSKIPSPCRGSTPEKKRTLEVKNAWSYNSAPLKPSWRDAELLTGTSPLTGHTLLWNAINLS
jgi:hypothetical protein